MTVTVVSKTFTCKIPCDRKPPWEVRPDGTVIFTAGHNRDGVGTEVWKGKPVVTASNRGRTAKVFGYFSAHGLAKEENAAPSGKGVTLHRFGGVTEFHTFEPVDGKKAAEIQKGLIPVRQPSMTSQEASGSATSDFQFPLKR